MKRSIKLAAVGVIGVVTAATALAATEQAGAIRGSGNEDDVVVPAGEAAARGGDAVARSGDAAVVARGEDARVVIPGEGGGDGVARGGDAVAQGENAVARGGDAVATSGDDAGEEGDVAVEEGRVLIKMEGDEGVRFSGTCTVGGEEEEIEGQVPQEFTFALGEGELECEVRKEGGGTLKMVVVSGNNRTVQQINGDSTLKLRLSDDGVSSSTTSSSSSVVSQSSSGSSGASVVQSSSSKDR